MRSNVIYEDNNYILVHKPAGLATQTARLGQSDLISDVKNYLAMNGIKNPYVAVINRLDQPVEGLVLLAKNEKTAALLSKQLTDGSIEKYYRAEVFGHLQEKQGRLEDYLVKDSKSNTSRVTEKSNKQAKKAILEYEVLESGHDTDKLNIHLITGRHHQIRVQFAHAGYSLIGDMKYGNQKSQEYSRKMGAKNVQLLSYRLDFDDPYSGERKKFSL